MQKFLAFLFLITVLSTSVQSQNRFGIAAGGIHAKSNLTNQYQSGFSSQVSSQFRGINSYFGGIVFDQRITSEFSIKYKLIYSNKGWTESKKYQGFASDSISLFNIGRINVPVETIRSREEYKFGYLDLPIHFTFYMPIGKSLFSFGAGPYASIGVSGKYSYKPLTSGKHFTTYQGNTISMITIIYNGRGANRTDSLRVTTYSATVTDSTDYLQPSSNSLDFKNSKSKSGQLSVFQFDYGGSVEASLEFRHGLCLNVSYMAGIVNVFNERYGLIQNRNRIFLIGIGYYLPKLSSKKKPS